MTDIYESDNILSEYLLFHFGNRDEILTDDFSWPAGMTDSLEFPVRTVAYFSKAPAERSWLCGGPLYF